MTLVTIVLPITEALEVAGICLLLSIHALSSNSRDGAMIYTVKELLIL